MKILVVDDSKLARMALAKALSVVQPSWARVEASNAEEALVAIRTSQPDVAVLDFNMPGKDGLALAADLRTLNPGMPIAVISANHQQEVVDRAQALGAAFLAKPLTERALREFLVKAEAKIKAAGS